MVPLFNAPFSTIAPPNRRKTGTTAIAVSQRLGQSLYVYQTDAINKTSIGVG